MLHVAHAACCCMLLHVVACCCMLLHVVAHAACCCMLLHVVACCCMLLHMLHVVAHAACCCIWNMRICNMRICCTCCMLHLALHRSGCALNVVRSCLFPRLPRDRPLAAAQARDQDARPVRARSNRLSRRRGFKLIPFTYWAVGGRAPRETG